MRTTRILAALAAVFLLTGCTAQMPEEELPVERQLTYTADVFFQNSDELLIPVSVQLSWSEDLASEAMSYLVCSGTGEAVLSEAGLSGVLPSDTTLTVSVENRAANVALSSAAINNMSEKQCQKAAASVVNTLLELPGIDSVTLSVNGEQRIGSVSLEPAMSSQSLNVDGARTAEKQLPVTLWFKTPEDGWLVPVTRYMSDNSVGAVADQLLAGPINTNKFMSLFPAGTKLKSISLGEDGVLTVDFSKEFSDIGSDKKKEQKLLRGIELTFGSLDNVTDIKITVEGEEYQPSSATMAGEINELVW